MKGAFLSDGDSTVRKILIADDQPDILLALHLLLRQEGYQTETVTSPAALLEALRWRSFDAVLMDLNYARDTTSGHEGLELISRIRAVDTVLPVVVMTAWGSVELAVEAMHRGMWDFVQKPWDNAQLLGILRTQIERGRALRKRQRLEAERNRELQEAREIQQALLPQEIPHIPGYEISVAWQPAGGLGGDYFDILEFNRERVALCIADAMGKGFPAALLMSNLQASVKAFATQATEPKELCKRINQAIYSSTAAGKFITFFYCLLDTTRRRLLYARAGHNAPILVRADGSSSRLQEGGAALGAFPDENYEQGDVELSTGDALVLFTDGVTELMNSDGEEFGEERLVRLLEKNRRCHAAGVRKRILQAVAAFGGGAIQDDATLAVLSVALGVN